VSTQRGQGQGSGEASPWSLLPASSEPVFCPDAGDLLSDRRLWLAYGLGDSLAVLVIVTVPVVSTSRTEQAVLDPRRRGPLAPPARTAGLKQRSSVGVSDQVHTLGCDYRLGHGY
jgi:hypothetical protein